ncbi:MAG: rod shape-determining protein MreD [Pseudomonadota bacterium]
MSEPSASRLWVMRTAFTALVITLIFFHLLPLQTAAGGWIWPDLILAFALAWSVRRPDYVPAPLLAAVFLMADLLLQRPPGLWAALALVACTQMQLRARSLRDATLSSELIAAAAWIIVVGISYRVALAIFLIDMPALLPSAIQITATVLAYPVVVAITHALMGVRKLAPGDFDGTGARV